MGRNSSVSACLKVFLIVVNSLFLLLGAAVLIVGVYLFISPDVGLLPKVEAGLKTLQSIRVTLVCCGCIILVVCLFGCVGSCKESSCLLTLYTVLISGVLIANIAIAVLAFLFKDEVKTFIKEPVKDAMLRFYGNDSDFTNGIDDIQRRFRCCDWHGPNSPGLFNSTPWYHAVNANSSVTGLWQLFPESCCQVPKPADPSDRISAEKYEKCVYSADNEMGLRHENCIDKLVTVTGVHIQITVGTVAAAILVQIVCLICGIILLCQVRRAASSAGGTLI